MRCRLPLFLLLVIFGTLASTAEGANAQWLLPPSTLSQQAVEEPNKPQVAIGPNGLTTVVWTRDIGARKLLEVTTRQPGRRSFAAPVDLTPLAGSDVSNPRIAIGPAGLTTIVYQLSEPGNDVIGVATRPAGTPTFSDVIGPSAAYPDNYSPRVAIGPDGTTTIVWASYDGGYKIAAATRAPGAGSYSGTEEISAGPSEYPRIAAGPDGSTTILYEGPSSVIVSTTRPNGGSSFPSAQPLSSTNAQGGEVAVGAGGTTAAVWTRNVGLFETVQATVRAPLPASFSAPVPISQDDNARDPEVAVGPDGSVTVVWVLADGPGGVVQASTKPARSTAFSAPVTLSDGGELIGYPKIAIGPDGRTTVVWSRGTGNEKVIQAATREAGATTFAPPIDLTEPGSPAYEVEIAAPPGAANPCSTLNTAVWEREMAVQEASEPAADCPALLARPKVQGPGKARLGAKATYRVTIRNTGSGAATGVRVRVIGKGVEATRKVGTLAAGKSKTVKLPLKFTRKGKVATTFSAVAKNAARKTVRKSVKVK